MGEEFEELNINDYLFDEVILTKISIVTDLTYKNYHFPVVNRNIYLSVNSATTPITKGVQSMAVYFAVKSQIHRGSSFILLQLRVGRQNISRHPFHRLRCFIQISYIRNQLLLDQKL